MPLNRCQIRNEYSLADPELYKVADKDDPEALLEGVAMAGLVGVLRQLGDLAEFAAEIFHDLHEEVMATASRGHGLIIRTQQLEAEFPSIERTLLSQTSHAAFLYNSGVEWHPNLRMDQSVVTRGDLPRFVMDSYEECRGPPRLFLLDKFDVAGAGACLKRFTDPSFFKTESTSSTGRNLEGQREKKTRRVKKRGPRWRNGDTPESFPSSHAKLHQLFLEERIESGINDPARRVKLKKRQFTGSLFEQDNVRSYMEKFLDTSPQDQKILHEICIDPLPLTWKSDNPSESGLDIVEIGTISPVKEPIQADKSLCSSPEVSEMLVKEPINDVYQDKNLTSYGEYLEVPALNHGSHDGSISEMSVGDTDDVASEIDNYMDALANIESEFETDSESKRNATHLNLKPIVADSDGSEIQRDLRSFSLDSHSAGNSIISEDGDNFSKERESSTCSDSFRMSKTTPALDSVSILANNTMQVSNEDSENLYFDHYSTEEIVRKEREKHAAAHLVHSEVDDLLKGEQMFGKATNTSSQADKNKKVTWSDMENGLEKKPVVPDSESEDSVKHDVILGELNQESTNQTAILHSNRTISDSLHAELSVIEKEYLDSSLYSDNNLALLPETNSHNNSASSLVEGHEMNLRTEDVDASSDSGSSVRHVLSSDAIHLDKENAIDVPCEEEFCIPSTQDRSKDLFCVSDSSASLGIQELLPETTHPGRTSSLNFSAENLPCSWQDPSVEDTINSVLHVGQAENLPGSSNQLQTHEFFSFDNIEAVKITDGDFSEGDIAVDPSPRDKFDSEASRSDDENFVTDSVTVKKASPVVDSLETQDEWPQIPSNEADTLLDVHQDEACEQISTNNIDTKDVGLDNPSQSSTVFNETNIDHAPANYHAENDSDRDLDVEKVDHIEKVDLEHVDSQDNDNHQNKLIEPPVLVSEDLHQNEEDLTEEHIEELSERRQIEKVDLEHVDIQDNDNHQNKLIEPPVLVSEDYQNEEDLTEEYIEELSERRQIDPVQDDSVTSTANFSNMSFDESPSISHDDSLPQNDKNIENVVPEGPSTLDGDNQVTLEEDSGKEPLSQQGIPDLGKRPVESRINLEPPSLPPLPPMQWRLGRFQNSTTPSTERQMMMNFPNMHHSYAPIPSMAPLAMHHAISSFQPVSLQTGNNPLGVIPQTTIPTSLPTVHYTFSPLQPVTLPIGDNGTENVSQTFTSEGQMGYSDGFVTSQGVFALPMPVGVSDGYFQINTSSVGVQDNRLLTVPLTSSALNGYVTQQRIIPLSMPMVTEGSFLTNTSGLGRQENMSFVGSSASTSSSNGTLFSKEPHHPNVDHPESGLLDEGQFSELDSVEVKVDNGNAIQNELLEHSPDVLEEEARNLNVQQTMDQPPPGLVAPDAERTWLSAYDGLDGNANATLQKRLPRPRNPLIDEVVAIDKSKLRKVERSRPQLQSKPEEGESILEQMQLRKVERVKPLADSKVEGGENLLEQLQLRKVGDRVKPSVEQKSEERDFLGEQLQLRKVGERVKPHIEPKSEEKEFLLEQMQLRKVKAKAKEDVETKVEETESPLAQLRKVRDRVREEVELKIEDSDSPRVLLRKVTDRVDPPVTQKEEERDSLFEQIRNKSFSLKPAVAARPNIQGPRTNLKVAAILEKASTIRQAMAGSDEDDDADSWSDES